MFDDLVIDPHTEVEVKGRGIWDLSHHTREQVIDKYHYACCREKWLFGEEFDEDELRIQCISVLELFEYDSEGNAIGFLV